MDQTAPDFVIFLGRFHPLIVHLPIGFLVVAVVMEWLGRKEKYQALGGGTAFVLFLTAASSWIAILLGWFLSLGGGYDEDILLTHKWGATGLAVFATAAWLIKSPPSWLPIAAKAGKAYIPLMVSSLLMLMLTGHNGGSLTHGSDYLFQYAPQPIRSMAGLAPKSETERKEITDINTALVFNDIIHPMLEDRCVTCHREGKKKGKLRLDSAEEFLKGGKHGSIVEAGKKDESSIFIRVNLPEEDEDRMPPEGKKPLTEEQIALIGWWIDAGAPMDKTVAEMEVPEEISGLLAALGPGGNFGESNAEKGIFAMQVPNAEPDKLAALANEGVMVTPISQETNLLRVSVQRDSTPFGDAQMALLVPLAPQITWLDLKHANPKDYSALAQLSMLTELHLEQSPVTDDDLQHLAGLEHLEYLNLYGTNISNAGLKHLQGLKKLKSLYLWQSKADAEGAKELMQYLPELSINLGWDQQLKPVSTE